MYRNLRPARRRPGMTLIEILVVIAIIAILAGLAAYAVIPMIGNRQARNTEATMRAINKVMQSHWKFVIDEARKDTLSDFPAIVNLAQPDASGERGRILLIKFRLMEAFPQSYAEIGTAAAPPFVYTNDATGNAYIPVGKRRYIAGYQDRMSTLVPANTNVATESSACLLMALKVTRSGPTLTDDLIKYAVVDTDGDGIPELVDGWNRTMAFFRFATNTNNNTAFNQSIPSAAKSRNAKFADPIDADGMLVKPNWVASANRTLYESRFHPVTNPYPHVGAGPYTAAYAAPVIVSAGNDGQFGLNLVAGPTEMKIMIPGQNNDNIYSFQFAASN